MTWFHVMLDAEERPKRRKKEKRFFSFGRQMKHALFQEMLDVLFFFLGVFTYFYLFALAWLYFGRSWEEHKVIAFFVNSLSEPYLGAVAAYVVLKEYRKQTRHFGNLHKGEVFVALWSILLALALLFTVFSDQYVLGTPLKIIMTNATAIILIYIGSVVHKP